TLTPRCPHVRRFRPSWPAQPRALAEGTRRSLELPRTLRDGEREGSLLSVVDRTVTAMGARALHDAILSPLAEKPAIDARLDAVEEFLRQTTTRHDLRELLESIPDLQRLTTRVSTGRASPKDLAGVGRVLRLLPNGHA